MVVRIMQRDDTIEPYGHGQPYYRLMSKFDATVEEAAKVEEEFADLAARLGDDTLYRVYVTDWRDG